MVLLILISADPGPDPGMDEVIGTPVMTPSEEEFGKIDDDKDSVAVWGVSCL